MEKIKYFFVWLHFKIIMKRLNNCQEISFSSLSSTTLEHPEFKKLTSLGPTIMPMLLKNLQKIRDDKKTLGALTILLALPIISGENPILKEHRGKMSKMQKDWIRWGKKKKYLK